MHWARRMTEAGQSNTDRRQTFKTTVRTSHVPEALCDLALLIHPPSSFVNERDPRVRHVELINVVRPVPSHLRRTAQPSCGVKTRLIGVNVRELPGERCHKCVFRHVGCVYTPAPFPARAESFFRLVSYVSESGSALL